MLPYALPRYRGARVITTASTDEKLEKARALGADEVINYRETPEFSKRVLELTDGQGVDLVFEHIGTPVWESCFASLKRGGILVTCGVTAGHRVSLHLGQLWRTILPKESRDFIRSCASAVACKGNTESTTP